MTQEPLCINVCDPPYRAAGDGRTSDRAAIQAAIDAAHAAGGGTVLLPEGRAFLASGLTLRSGVTLLFGDGAALLQDPDPTAYVKPTGSGYVPYSPQPGHNYSETVKWSHCWYHNYPLIYAPPGAHGFAVRGNGTIRMAEAEDPARLLKICPIGFYRCSDFEIADVHITNYHSYALMPFTCERGVFRNLKVDHSNHGNGDGICLMNCRHIRVTGCVMDTGDDAVYIFSSYRDPRRGEWWNSDAPQASEDIEIDHNDLKTNHCKAFGMILWGIDCPDQEAVEVRNVYVHDNRFETMGNWLYNPYSDRGGDPPVTDVRFENNEIGGIEINFFETQISDCAGFRSTAQLQNGHFEQGRCFWCTRAGGGAGAGVRRGETEETRYGFLTVPAAEGFAELYEGVYLEAGRPVLLRAELETAGGETLLFVRNQNSGETVAEAAFDADGEALLRFTVPANGNYRVGFQRRSVGETRVRHVTLGSHPAAAGCRDVIYDRGKMIFIP